jgi:hypothetical protein
LYLLECVRVSEIAATEGAKKSYQGKGFDDTFARVARIANNLARSETEGCFPSIESFVFLICRIEHQNIRTMEQVQINKKDI